MNPKLSENSRQVNLFIIAISPPNYHIKDIQVFLTFDKGVSRTDFRGAQNREKKFKVNFPGGGQTTIFAKECTFFFSDLFVGKICPLRRHPLYHSEFTLDLRILAF